MITLLKLKRWFFITIFFTTTALFSFPLQRTIFYDNFEQTTHFNIFWSDNYPQNDIWLTIKNDSPLFIDTLKKNLENAYTLYEKNNLSLPQQLDVYVLNTNLSAINPPLSLNDISSLGAFTSDINPEILINANINNIFVKGKFLSYNSRLSTIILHELMHAHQYTKGLISKEKKQNQNLWFIEGLAVGFELYNSNDLYYRDFTRNYLAQNINKGFLYDDYYLSYSAGLFYEYLVRQKYVSFKELDTMYNDDYKEYFRLIAKKANKPIYTLLREFYKSLGIGTNTDNKIAYGGAYVIDVNATYMVGFEKAKNLLQDDYLTGDGKIRLSPYKQKQELLIKKGWHMLGFNLPIDEATLSKINGIIWSYNDGQWSCYGNSDIQEICKKSYKLLKSIAPNNGFWVYEDNEKRVSIQKSFVAIKSDYVAGWNLTTNPTDTNLTYNGSKLIWEYDDNWHNSYEENITIIPNEGFWIRY